MTKVKIDRRFFIRLAAIIIVIVIGVIMFFIGKQHTIIIDNRSVGDISALRSFDVGVDDSEMLGMSRMMREQFVVTGQRHTVHLEVDGEMISFDIDIPLGESMVILSVPLYMADRTAEQSVWLTPFVSQATSAEAPSAEDNTVVLDDTASFSSF